MSDRSSFDLKLLESFDGSGSRPVSTLAMVSMDEQAFRAFMIQSVNDINTKISQ